ncbi:MAG: EAL domain-containing protein [Caldimicrobium sp.]|nr:EAL domain-containing protein [Caldimicrobium sp.]MCX7874053.1 EAL domain-containing protein [Caldimicrobium sp.]MDW8093877.1 EAL domain-containing protein [Caldimicrobium sp.]
MGEKERTFQEILNPLEDKIFTKIPFDFTEIETFFQPVINLSNFEILGYEALTKPLFGKNVDNLFKRAQEHEILFELDLFFRIKALLKASSEGLSSKHLLFLNIHPLALLQELYHQEIFQKSIRQLGFNPEQIVLEITNCQLLEDWEDYLKNIFHLLRLGYKISLDDYGGSSHSYIELTEIKPNFVKIDQFFIMGGLKDAFSKKFIEHILEICQELGITVVIKGVEGREEFLALLDMGVKYYQGNYFGKPVFSLKGGESLEIREYPPQSSHLSYAYF